MKNTRRQKLIAAFGLALGSVIPLSVGAQIAPSIATPDKVESSIGTLKYKDGAPSKKTVAKAYDYLDLMRGVEAFTNAYQGASVASIFKGMQDAGILDGDLPLDRLDCHAQGVAVEIADRDRRAEHERDRPTDR